MSHRIKLLFICATAFPSVTIAGDLFDVPASRAGLFEHQVAVFERMAGPDRFPEIALIEPQAAAPEAVQQVRLKVPTLRGPHLALYRDAAITAARRNGIDENLFLALVQQESGWNRNARSPVGAIGFAQLMPGTAGDLNVDPYDPLQNLDGGARYLRTQYERFGDWRLALAAYNAGPGAVSRYNGIPPYAETQNYVRRIAGSVGM